MTRAPESPQPEQESPLKEALAIYGVVFLMVLALALLGQLSGLISANLYLIVAVVFMGVPSLWMQRKKLEQERFGMTTRALARQVGVGLLAGVLTCVPFCAGQYVWETQVRERTFHFDLDNWYKWPLELDGEPDTWGERPGAWVWTEEGTLHVGMRAEERVRSALHIKADTAFVPVTRGSGTMLRAVSEGGQRRTSRTPATHWELLPVLYGRPVEVVLEEEAGAKLPRGMTFVTARADGYEEEPVALHLGSQAQEQEDNEASLSRGMLWILMWLVTQLFFIALPEEYFYRGYIQTRLGDAFKARGTRKWWIVTPQNLATSVLFGLGHLFIPVGGVLLPGRFSVFFPSLLFGLLRERTGSITASVVYHACCNMMVLVWVVHYV